MRFLLAVLLVGLVGCAHDVRTQVPGTIPGEPTGVVVLVFTNAQPDVYVAINGVLVVDGAHTQRVRIEGVATGYADVAIAAGPVEKQQRIWVDSDRETVLPMAAPGGSALDGLKSMAMSLAAIAIYAWIR